jgi:hypothetical protein
MRVSSTPLGVAFEPVRRLARARLIKIGRIVRILGADEGRARASEPNTDTGQPRFDLVNSSHHSYLAE